MYCGRNIKYNVMFESSRKGRKRNFGSMKNVYDLIGFEEFKENTQMSTENNIKILI